MGLFCGDIGHRYGDIGLFFGRCRALLQRHGLACGCRGLFCGDIGLFGRDTGLFCGRHRAFLQRHGLLCGCTGLFCRDIGHFCGDTGPFPGRCRALLQSYGLLRGCTGLFCSPTAQCVPRRRGFPQGSRRKHLSAWFLKNNLPCGTVLMFSHRRLQLLVEVWRGAGMCDDPCILAYYCSSASL